MAVAVMDIVRSLIWGVLLMMTKPTKSQSICNEDFCSNGGTCRDPNDNCTCPKGWTGATCDEAESSVNHTVILLSVFFSISLVTIVLLVAVIIILKLKRNKLRAESRDSLEEFSINTHENAAYQLLGASNSSKRNPPCKVTPCSNDQLDAIYENPLESKAYQCSEEDITYENPNPYMHIEH